jgi:hypothetical protein
MTNVAEVATPDNVCGRAVFGQDGRELGIVVDVLATPAHEAEYLVVATEDDGSESVLVIPRGAVARMTSESVHLILTGAEVAVAARYDPLVPEEQFLDRLSQHYTSTLAGC